MEKKTLNTDESGYSGEKKDKKKIDKWKQSWPLRRSGPHRSLRRWEGQKSRRSKLVSNMWHQGNTQKCEGDEKVKNKN